MAGRVTHLSAVAFALTVTFLRSSAIVPGPNECWEDRIYAFSGPPMRCDLAKKRCENETVLLKNATEECGQMPRKYTFIESCGDGRFFGIDYTCCAPYKYHNHCFLSAQWDQSHTDTLIGAMKKSANLAKAVEEAKASGDSATADRILMEQLHPTMQLIEHSSPFIDETVEDLTGCHYTSHTDTLIGAMKKSANLAKAMEEAKTSGDSATADRILMEQLHPAMQLIEHSSPFIDESVEDLTGCKYTYKSRLSTFLREKERNHTISRQFAYVSFRDEIRKRLFSARFATIPNTVTSLLESGYNCKKYSHFLSEANPDVMWSEVYSYELCAFFPELKKQAGQLT
uniref:Secreted protein n=1 Tax=Steinernema glaseri TaxID=37863 RepID=A0A1I8A050_9BILA